MCGCSQDARETINIRLVGKVNIEARLTGHAIAQGETLGRNISREKIRFIA